MKIETNVEEMKKLLEKEMSVTFRVKKVFGFLNNYVALFRIYIEDDVILDFDVRNIEKIKNKYGFDSYDIFADMKNSEMSITFRYHKIIFEVLKNE